MPEETQISTVGNPEAASEQGQAQEPATQQAQADGIGGTETQDAQGTFFDPKNVPPELEPAYKNMQAAFTKKTQEIAGERRKAQAFDQLAAHPGFREWYYQQINGAYQGPTAGQATVSMKQEEKPPELSEEDYAALAQDPKRLAAYVNAVVQHELKSKVLPVAEKAQIETQVLKKQAEIDEFSRAFPDFWELDEKGLIEPLVARYPNLDIADIYKLAKFPAVYQDATARAHKQVEGKRGAVVEKPGIGSAAGSGIVKVKNREEAMLAAWDAAKNGRPVPEFEYEKNGRK